MKKKARNVYLELCRLPNLFTVPGDVLVGWSLSGCRGQWPLAGILASLCLYIAGLFFNDVADATVDAHERSQRPIPSGRISRLRVFVIGVLLSVIGIVLAWSSWPMAVALLALIVTYDFVAKRISRYGGALTMGACRGVNILLGMSVSWAPQALVWPVSLIIAVVFFTAYIMLVTLAAQHEATPTVKLSSRLRWLPVGIITLLIPYFWWMGLQPFWPIFVALGLAVGIAIFRRTVPELIGAFIRLLIPLQGLWCLSCWGVSLSGILLFGGLYIGALISSRYYAGS